MDTLDDLRRIIRRIEHARPPRPAPEAVEDAVGGTLVETANGTVVLVRREYARHHRHGRYPIDAAFSASADVLSVIARNGDVPADPARFVFVDTETTGLAGGTGTYAFLVGVGYLEEDRFVVDQYFMRDFDDEAALLSALEPIIAGATALVTFNGAGFDLPLLETRFILARRRSPAVLPHLDLLAPSRRIWGPWLDDCRLPTLEREVLGLLRENDIAGGLIPAVYFDFLRRRNPKSLPAVFSHNRHDVLSLAALLGWLARVLSGDERGLTPEEHAGLGRLWERADLERSRACYEAALMAGLGGDGARWVRLRLALWEKRCARWEAACALWEAAARECVFDPRPWEELAKFHEHRRRDAQAARAIVTTALGAAEAARAPSRVIEAFAYRLARLERRLQR
ncbi:MAG TPA: ribonuclease H-like domain-containing protein [Methylomirabilota bacterium]